MATGRYTKVAALIIRWTEELDIQASGHSDEIDKLVDAFKRFKFAKFDCKVVRLTNKRKPQGQLERAISDHIDDHDGSRSLLIVYYTGHGMGLEEDKLGLAALGFAMTATELHDPVARWDDAERPLIGTADADVLTILDCCYSSNAVKAVTSDPRVYELLAACPFNEKTWGPSPTSFTTALTTALNHLLDKHGQEGFAVRALIQHIQMIRTKPVAMYWDRLGTYQRSIILAPGPGFSMPELDGSSELKFVAVSEGQASVDGGERQKMKKSGTQADIMVGSSAGARQDDIHGMKGEELHEATELQRKRVNPVVPKSEGGHAHVEAPAQPHDLEANNSGSERNRERITTTESEGNETSADGSIDSEVIPMLPGPDDDNLQQQSWFQNEVDNVLGKANGYLHVAVLMIHWHESIDDFEGQTEEIGRLQSIFRDQFNYDCSVVSIKPSPKAQRQFNRAIIEFMYNHDGPDNLLIVYYTGHGTSEVDKGSEPGLMLYPHRHSGPTGGSALGARWNNAEAPLRHGAESDVITILDCSFASTAALKAAGKSARAYQVIASSTALSPARVPGRSSFSTSLANSLEELVHESKMEGFPLPKLVERINMQSDGYTPVAVIWDRLHTFGHSIHLAPMPKEKRSSHAITVRTGEPETGALILRFSLKNTAGGLTLKQIDALARQLPKACTDAKVPLRRIEWLRYISRENLRARNFRDAVRTVMLVKAVCRKWRSYVQARRQQHGKDRAQSAEEVSELTNIKRKRSRDVNMPPLRPLSKQARHEGEYAGIDLRSDGEFKSIPSPPDTF